MAPLYFPRCRVHGRGDRHIRRRVDIMCAMIALGLMGSISGCSGSENGTDAQDVPAAAAPSAREAKAALQTYFDHNPECTPFFDLPTEIMVAETYRRRQLDGFVAAGVVSAGPAIVKVKGSLYPQDHVIRYALTSAGAKLVRAGHQELAGAKNVICYGRRQVEGVKVGSLDEIGGQVSIQYRYRITDKPTWTQQPAVLLAYPALAPKLASTDIANEDLSQEEGRWLLRRKTDIGAFDFRQFSH